MRPTLRPSAAQRHTSANVERQDSNDTGTAGRSRRVLTATGKATFPHCQGFKGAKGEP